MRAALASVDIFQRLKESTAEIHRLTEERVPVFRPDFDLAQYGRLLERFYGFWAPLEAKLTQITELQDPELDLRSRLKSSLLREDLRFLGRDDSTVRYCESLPAVDTFARGVGCLYVFEGSTLGGRFIARRLETHLQLRAGSGASYFNAYGDTVGRRWSEFKAFAWGRVGDAVTEQVLAAARQTFQAFFEWLNPAL